MLIPNGQEAERSTRWTQQTWRCAAKAKSVQSLPVGIAVVLRFTGAEGVRCTGRSCAVAATDYSYFMYSSVDLIRLDLNIPAGSQTGLKTVF